MDSRADRIGFILIKIAAYVRRSELRRRIEESAFSLIEAVAKRDLHRFFELAPAIEAIVRIGKSIYEIEPMNADMVISEIGSLNSEIRQIAELSLPPRTDQTPELSFAQNLWSIGSSSGLRKIEEDIRRYRSAMSKQQSKSIGKTDDILEAKASDHAGEKVLPNGLKNSSSDNAAIPASDNPAIRQSAIADRIMKFGGKTVQLKDIIAEFSNVSERTLRYDLQRLCSQGIIERIGQGGPGTYYRTRVI